MVHVVAFRWCMHIVPSCCVCTLCSHVVPLCCVHVVPSCSECQHKDTTWGHNMRAQHEGTMCMRNMRPQHEGTTWGHNMHAQHESTTWGHNIRAQHACSAYTVASCACTVCLWNLTQITPHRRACIMTWTYALVSSCSRRLLFVELEHDALDNVSPIVKFFPGTWLILKLNRIIHILKRWTRIGSSSRSFELNNGTKGLWLVLILNCNPTR